mmetsp:Transcript_13527/g.18557  ORF Transcript_13527/g.18557 Transcript_13527/m.18557 type:complete len:436 (-) Transcript_13527:132-1439(-)
MRLHCKECAAVLSEPLERALALPSVGWRELAEEWFCGSACCGPGEDVNELLQRLEDSLTPSPATALVGSTVFLVTESDASGTRIKSSLQEPANQNASSIGWRIASCKCCSSVVGIASQSVKEVEDLEHFKQERLVSSSASLSASKDSEDYPVITLFKHRVSVVSVNAPQDKSQEGECCLESSFVEDILGASRLHGNSRFNLYKLTSPEPVIKLILLSTDGFISQGQFTLPESVNVEKQVLDVKMEPFIKVLYKEVLKIGDKESELMQGENNVSNVFDEEELRMVPSELDELISILRESNLAHPRSCREFNGYRIGHLFVAGRLRDIMQVERNGEVAASASGSNATMNTDGVLDSSTPSTSLPEIMPTARAPPPPPPPNLPESEPRVGSFMASFGGKRKIRNLRMQWGTFCIDKSCDDCEPGMGGTKPQESHFKRT